MKRLASFGSVLWTFIFLLSTLSIQQAKAVDLSEETVRAAMLAFERQYPEGTPFDNSNSYTWHGGIYQVGTGCAAFAFMLSDAAFGSLPARKYYDYTQIRVGDILRLNNEEHCVIVLYVNPDKLIVAEGNFNGKIHWRREMPISTFQSSKITYALTRYPENTLPASQKGDANSDTDISTDDAQIVLQTYTRTLSGLPSTLTEIQSRNADVDENGDVNILDAQYILIYYSENILAERPCSWEQIISKS